MNDELKEDGPSEETTSPGQATHEATKPEGGGGEPDTEPGRKVEEQLDQAGSGN